ncbi:bifunctional metallophosphatase/5'-nucleotidase [Oceanobacillus sp. CAU 1775]
MKGCVFLKEELTIIYTSDIHGHAMPINYGTNNNEDIGLAKYATAVKEARRTKENLLLIDNGDLIQGTPLMTNYVKNHTDLDNPMVAIMNQLEIDAGVLGNHEFNYGHLILNQAVQQANFPVLSANILNKKTGKPQYGEAYIMKTIGDNVKVAIVGVTTHYIPNWESAEHIEGLEFADAFETLKKWVKYIKENEHPDVIIASYHGGFEADIHTGAPTEDYTGENQGYKICQEIEGIDVLLTGHQHRELTGVINDVLVIQPGKNGLKYGEVTLELSKDNNGIWNVSGKTAEIQTFEDLSADQETLEFLKPYEESTQEWLGQPIGFIKGDMTIDDPFQVRLKKHPFIQFIQDVQMELSGATISVTSLLNNESTGFSSSVTMREIVSNYMYPNTLMVLEITGADIKAALEQTAKYFTLNNENEIEVEPTFVEPKPQHYNYDMWEGIEYTLNISRPVGERVEAVTYKGNPVSPTATYQVVVNNYRAAGGGNYEMFKGKKVIREIQKDAVTMIQEYFEKHPTVEAYVNENFKITKR